MRHGQTFENQPQKRRISFTGAEEAVILRAAEKRRFPVTFPANRTQRPQWDSVTMENQGPPEGHTEESWAAMKRAAAMLDFNVGPVVTAPRRQAIQSLRDGKSYVYFIGGDVGRIKIGLSIAPLERVATLNTGSPIPLRLLALAEGGRELERQYHQRFAAHRAHGEWFERVPEVEAEIETLRPLSIHRAINAHPDILAEIERLKA